MEAPPGVEPGPFRGVGFAIRHVTVPSRRLFLAERAGFEPADRFHDRHLSKVVP